VIYRLLCSVDKRLHTRTSWETSSWAARFAAGVALVVGIFMTSIALRMYGPTVHPDEFGFLINGQVLIGRDETPIPTGSFYPAGYGLLTGLGHLVTGSMSGAYTFALLVNVGLACATAWFAARLAVNGFGASKNLGVIAGALVFVVPGTIVSAMFSWAETAARLAFLVFVAIVLRAAQTFSRRDVVGLGLFVGLMPALHGRFTLLIPVVGLVVLWWWVRQKISFTSTALSVVSMIVGYGFSYGLNTFIKTAVYTTSYDQENRLLRRLADPSVWPALIRTMVGQSWYLIATSLGLFGVAVFFIVARVISVVRHKRDLHDPETTALLVMLLGTLAVIFTGGLQLLYGDRGDHLIYGRYVEMMVPAFLVVACVALERTTQFAHRAIFVTGFLILAVAAIYVLVDQGDGVKGGYYRNLLVFPNIVGTDIARYFVTPGLITFALFFFAGTAGLWVIMRQKGVAALLVMVLLIGAGSMYSGQRSILSRTGVLEKSGVTSDIATAGNVDVIGFDKGVRNDRAYYYMRYLLHPVNLLMLDISSPEGAVPDNLQCLYGWVDRPPVEGDWIVVAEETALGRVLWQRVGATSC
jgi:hypothetical protein